MGPWCRNRGKLLVLEPYIADTDDRNQEFRCQVRREQPFRSTTNDVTQAADRCNVDFQFLPCAPPLPRDDEEPAPDNDAPQLEADSARANSGAAQPAVPRRRRIRKKTGVVKDVGKPAVKKRWQRPAWFPGSASLSSKDKACVTSFAAAFRKAASMDFYITKYQGKPMESLTPLFQPMTDGVHRLERQEEEEEAEAESAKKAFV